MRENLSFFVHWPLLLYMKSVSGCFSLHCCAFAFPPWEFSISLSLSLPSNWFKYVYRKTNCTHNTLLTLGGVESPSERAMNGETELKTYFVGDLKHNAVNYDFFFSVFIRDFLFSRCPDPSVTFSLSLTREWICALVWTQWFNELARKKTFITIYCFFLFKTFRVYCSYIK